MRDNDTLAQTVTRLTTEARTALYDLWMHGPMADQNVAQSLARRQLKAAGLAAAVDNHTYLTADGVRACIIEFDAKELQR